MPMLIAAWNINSIKARQDLVLDWVKENKPDLLFMQELKTDGEHYPTEKFKDLGYASEIKGQKGYAGVATIVKDDLDYSLISKDLFDEDEQARYVEIICDSIHMINIYAPNGNPYPSEKFDFKMDWYRQLEQKVAGYLKEGRDVLIGGDFNIIPEDKDCYDPNAWKDDALFVIEAKKIYRRLINMGFTDSLRVFDQAAEIYTFWDYQAGAWPRNNGIRIDHFLCSPNVTDRLKSCTIDKQPRGLDKPSDHTPILIELS